MSQQKPRIPWRPSDTFHCIHHFIGDACAHCFHRRPKQEEEEDVLTVEWLMRFLSGEDGLPDGVVVTFDGAGVRPLPLADPAHAVDRDLDPDLTTLLDDAVLTAFRIPEALVRRMVSPLIEISLDEPAAGIPVTRSCGCAVCLEGETEPHAIALRDDPVDAIADVMWTEQPPAFLGEFAVRCTAGHVTHPLRQYWIHDNRCYYDRAVGPQNGVMFCFKPTFPLEPDHPIEGGN